jgi:ribosomal protein S27AE
MAYCKFFEVKIDGKTVVKAKRECPKCGQIFVSDEDKGTKHNNYLRAENTFRAVYFCPDCAKTHESNVPETDRNDDTWLFVSCTDCCEICISYDLTGDCSDILEDERAFIANDRIVCPDCYDNYTMCERCEDLVHINDTREVIVSASGGTEQWCNHCASNNTIECESCGDLHDTNICPDTMYSDDSGSSVCVDCFHESYFICSNCDCIVHIDNLVRSRDGEAYCQSCAEDIEDDSDIQSYHADHAIYFYDYKKINGSYEPVSHRHYQEQDKALYLALEMEVDDPKNRCDKYDLACSLNSDYGNNGMVFNIQEDSSVSEGFEVVWQPMTMSYLYNQGFDLYKHVAEKCVSAGMLSGDTNTCGGHIHASRAYFGDTWDEQEETISRLLYITHKFRKEVTRFCRRTESSAQRWAGFCDVDLEEKANRDELANKCTILNSIKDVREAISCDRYSAINVYTHKCHTVEFRLPKGTLNIQTIIANFEFYASLIDLCKKSTFDDLYKIKTFEDLCRKLFVIVNDWRYETPLCVTGKDSDIYNDSSDRKSCLNNYLERRGLL